MNGDANDPADPARGGATGPEAGQEWERAVTRALAEHDESIAALARRVGPAPLLAASGRRALVALVWADLALVLWWAAMSARAGLSPLPGAVVCAFAVLAALVLLMWTRAETRAEARRARRRGEGDG